MNIAVDTLKHLLVVHIGLKHLRRALKQLKVFQLRFGRLMVRLISKQCV